MKELLIVGLLAIAVVFMVLAWRSPTRFRQWCAAMGMSDGPLDKAIEQAVSADPELEKRIEALESENEALKSRLAALETIVTDSGFELDQQIRKLG
ncbi:hypothetical protein [Ferrimonas marina]|uniref:Phage shock protein B n=1 Tax=Ferrimonas marina TaxID=299255 RepID=A0A1M5X0E3_9GAMM|nr:hypothetical protein [Ferrimonas marina]SHH93395.1 hypothetical protein SAMN02745129_3133 [Ferrimonas marina]